LLIFKATPVHLSYARFLVLLSTWYHRSQVFLVLKYRMLSSINIDAICVSSLSPSVYFSWVLDKNYWRSSIAYHLFVNSATFVSGMRLFPKWWRKAWLRWSSWSWLAVLVCMCGPSSLPWNLVFCSLSPLQSLKTPLVVSLQRTTCIYVGAASMLSFLSASFKNSFKIES